MGIWNGIGTVLLLFLCCCCYCGFRAWFGGTKISSDCNKFRVSLYSSLLFVFRYSQSVLHERFLYSFAPTVQFTYSKLARVWRVQRRAECKGRGSTVVELRVAGLSRCCCSSKTKLKRVRICRTCCATVCANNMHRS